MRRWLMLALMAGLPLPGCTLFESNKPETQAPKLKVSHVPPVRPDHVTPANALQKARELNEELDRDAEGEVVR